MRIIGYWYLTPLLVALASSPLSAQEQLITVDLSYVSRSPGAPTPDFSPKGTQVMLRDAPASLQLPAGAVRPVKTGLVQVGMDSSAWIPVLVAASREHPEDLHQLWLDRNRNGSFLDDGEPLKVNPTQNEKTRAWWSSLPTAELSIPYPTGVTEPYQVNFWLVRDDSLPPPDVLRYSVQSWRQGRTTVRGVEALVAVMDGDNNAVYDQQDSWSVLGAAEKDAVRAVLSLKEARSTARFMFVPAGDRDMVLEFRSLTPDGSKITFAVTDKLLNKTADRAPDDMLREERPRPRATVPFNWEHGGAKLEAALDRARAEGKKLLIDFETTWCGPCQSMDQWIWTDKEVAAALNAGFVGLKLDGDIEKALVKQYDVKGYPTMIILDADGTVRHKVSDYLSSRQVLEMLARR